MKPQQMIESVYDRDWVVNRAGDKKQLAGAVSQAESNYLFDLITTESISNTLETGVANGLSTLAITAAVKENDGQHTGIDPFQVKEHGEAAVVLLEEFRLQDYFQLIEGPSEIVAPKLVGEGKSFDLIFIDGMHLFEFKMLDVFYSDRLLEPGGWLILHDLLIPSVKKTFRFIDRHLDYQFIPTPELRPGLAKRLRYLVGATIKLKPMFFQWPNGFSNMLVLRKRSNVNNSWSYFKNF